MLSFITYVYLSRQREHLLRRIRCNDGKTVDSRTWNAIDWESGRGAWDFYIVFYRIDNLEFNEAYLLIERKSVFCFYVKMTIIVKTPTLKAYKYNPNNFGVLLGSSHNTTRDG